MRTFFIITVLVLFSGYLGYGWFMNIVFERNKQSCVEKIQDNPLFRGDVTQLCACTMDFTRTQPFFDKEDPAFRKEFGVRMVGCAKVHVKQHGTDQCDALETMFRKKTRKALDCGCMNQKILNVFMKQWAENGKVDTTRISKSEENEMVNGCLK